MRGHIEVAGEGTCEKVRASGCPHQFPVSGGTKPQST